MRRCLHVFSFRTKPPEARGGLRNCEIHRATTFKNYADLLNYTWLEDHKLPDTLAGNSIHSRCKRCRQAGPGLRALPEHHGNRVLMSRVTVGWIRQLVKLGRPWALHADATHKFHIGGWALTTFGTHPAYCRTRSTRC
jgi:hypothetical protein